MADGRLIDKEELIKMIQKELMAAAMTGSIKETEFWDKMLTYIREVPTISKEVE